MSTELSVFRQAAEATARAVPSLGWLRPVREQALAQFMVNDFPDVTEEDWRYTNLSPAVALATKLAQQFAASPAPQPDTGLQDRALSMGFATMATLLDGVAHVSTPGSLPHGLSIRRLIDVAPEEHKALATRIRGRADAADQPLPALNTALLRDGLLIEIAAGAAIEAPVYVAIATGAGAGTYNRVLIDVGAGARATLIEHHLGRGASVSNSVTDVICAAGARLSYVKLQDEADDGIHLATQGFHLGNQASAELLHLDLGSRLARNDLRVELAGDGATVSAHGLFFADGSRHLDNHTRVDHRAPHTVSRELYRGIADSKGRGVFNGKVIVHAGAGGTDAQLRNQNLLLSSGAEIDTKPELEIYADDVKCSHGATTGQLDATAIFYLRSRGIPAEDARRMLIASFAREIVGRLPAGAIEKYVLALLHGRLPAIGEVAGEP